MQKLIVLRALSWGRDARVERWSKIYNKNEAIFGVWGNEYPSISVYSIMGAKRYSNNKILMGFSYIWFSLKSFYFVLKYAKKNDVVVFIDLETILFGWLGAYIKGANIHYDMADPFYLVKPIPGKKIWKYIESLFVLYSPIVSAPHRLRLLLFVKKLKNNMCIVENVPYIEKKNNEKKVNLIDKIKHKNITIGYFGGLEENVRGLENITKIILKDKRLKLIVAGDGTLKDYFKKVSKECERIIFLGKFLPTELESITKDIDIYFAYYSPDKDLHKIAAPNKYYEHLFLNIPILTSCVIPQSKEVIEYNTGWCIKNDKKELSLFINNLFDKSINFATYKKNCNKVWNSKYLNYYNKIQKIFK